MPLRLLSATLATAALVAAWPSAAQNMDSAKFELQPLQYMKEGKVTGCGARLIATVPWGSDTRGRAVDVSANLNREMAFFKALSYDVSITGSTPSIRAAPIDMAWVKAQGSAATKPLKGKPVAGETPESILYVTEYDTVVAVLTAVVKGQSIQVGVKRKAESGERIFYGPVEAAQGDLQQLALCIAELAK